MNNTKIIKYFFLVGLVALTIYFILGYINSFIGYYGYNKHKVRRYSSSVTESKERNVFIGLLNYSVSNDVKINDIFVEKGFRWGSSDKETLEFNDENPVYQLIIDYKEKQDEFLIYIPENRMLIKNKIIKDTIQFKIFVRDYNNQLIKEELLKVWQ